MNLFALPCFKGCPVITPPLKASGLNKRRGEGELIRGSAVFISNLKNENQETFRLFGSTCMHLKCHVTITSKFITQFVYRNLMSSLPPFSIKVCH